jgi:EpsI family protein
VDVYVAAFGLGLSGGAEMISYRNRLSEHEQESLLPQRDVLLELAGTPFTVREFVVPGARGSRLAWRWYLVGERVFRFDSHVKAAEALAYLRGGDASDRVLVVSSPVEQSADAARTRLRAFIDDHAICVRSGFMPESCAP